MSGGDSVSGGQPSGTDAPREPQTGRDSHIQIENLRKTFARGSVVACDDIDLEIAKDDFVILLGPSGCGKTTTLRCIAGLEEPDSGQIFINGEEVTYRKPKDRDLAFVFQRISLYPHMSVRRNIRFGLDMKTDLPKAEKNDRVEDVAEMLGIEDLLDRKPSALSGGQQQRVSLGRAMVMEPQAFLLDEPFSALDANLRDQMRTEIKKLQRTLETAMVFVTHDQEEAMTLGDKIVIMRDGLIQQIGSAYDIYNEPTNKFVADFIGSPSTNMFECVFRVGEDAPVLESEIFELPLSDEQRTPLSVDDGEPLSLGVRPEHLRLGGSEPLFEADIDVIEPHGNQDAVHLSASGIELTAIVKQGAIGRERDSIGVSFDEDETWLFDADGDRLL